jgi:nickel transport protein
MDTGKPRSRLGLGAVLALVLFACPAFAHRVNVFAYVEGNDVVVECSYSRSERVRYGEIDVFNAATGALYLSGTTDEKGEFRFPVPPAARAAKAGLRVVLNAGEGHQNSTEVTAAEYLAAAPGAPAPAAPASAQASASPAAPLQTPGPAGVVETGQQPAGPAPLAGDAAALSAVVEAAVEKKIAPLRAMLVSDKEKGPGLTEIVGGIGWLVGLGGLAAFFAARGKRNRP